MGDPRQNHCPPIVDDLEFTSKEIDILSTAIDAMMMQFNDAESNELEIIQAKLYKRGATRFIT
tara:strand:- start:544 stop:732 length:189 start_codon:yes stop_codon:yes gene_type:complete